MMLATVDVLPQPYTVLGLVSALVNANYKLKLGNPGRVSSEEGMKRLDEEAKALGADAVIGVRFASVGPGQVLVSGTAVRYAVG